jgi:hypothetical protein
VLASVPSAHAVCDLHCAVNSCCCRLSDVLRQASVVCMDHGWQRHLMSVMRYAASTQGCRRAMLAAHFAEPPPACNGTCDLCAAAAAAAQSEGSDQQLAQQQDLTQPAKLVLQVLQVGGALLWSTMTSCFSRCQANSVGSVHWGGARPALGCRPRPQYMLLMWHLSSLAPGAPGPITPADVGVWFADVACISKKRMNSMDAAHAPCAVLVTGAEGGEACYTEPAAG